MKLIYSLINRTSKADGLLEFKLVITREDYALLKYFESRDIYIAAEFNEDEIKHVSDNVIIQDKKMSFAKVLSLRISPEIFRRSEKGDGWESEVFSISFVTVNVTAEQLYNNFKNQIQKIMSDLKTRAQPDNPCWEESEELEY